MTSAPDPDRSNSGRARLLALHPDDNVAVSTGDLSPGPVQLPSGAIIAIERQVSLGHKICIARIDEGSAVVKYGAPIGAATRVIQPGEHVHVHNLRSAYTLTHSLERTVNATDD